MFDPQIEREFLLQNIESINSEPIGNASVLHLSGEVAFPILIKKDTRSVFVAGSALDSGRVVVLGHSGFFDEVVLANDQIFTLLNNSIYWVNNNDNPPIILVKGWENLADLLIEHGFEVEKTDCFTDENLENCSVIMGNLDEMSEENELQVLDNAIRNGKGAILVGVSWVWEGPIQDYFGNKLLADAGIQLTKDAFDFEIFEVDTELSEWISYEQAKDFVLENDYNTEDRKMLGKCLRHVMDVISKGGQENFAIQTDFPPNPADATPITKDIEINTQNAFWNSTGLYAQAGENIIFYTENSFPSGTFKIRIGAHTDWLYDLAAPWERMPELSLCFDLNEGETIVFNPFGGTIYIEVPENYQGDNLHINVSGAIEAPLFKLGETSLEDWNEYIRYFPAPFGEIVGNEFAITVRSEYLTNLDNPNEVAEFWDTVQDANQTLSSWQSKYSHHMRIVFDKQISMGYMHSGYPVVAFIGNEEQNVLDIHQPNKWGFYHELGHNHQVEAWDFEGSEEVTCNVFTLYVMEHVSNLTTKDIGNFGFYDITPEYLIQKWKEYEDNDKRFAIWQDDPFFALSTYRQLIKYYGWDSIINVFDAYHYKNPEELPQNNQQKMDLWLKTYSEVVQEDLSDFFEAWNIPISQNIKESLASLPKANVEEILVFEDLIP